MAKRKPSKKQEEETFPATVVKVLSPYRVVINRGAAHNIKEGQRFLIYRLSSQVLKDPITQRALGHLEFVRGTGKVIHVQEQLSTIESDQRQPSERRIVRSGSPFVPVTSTATSEEIIVPSRELVPFDQPRIRDKAKPI